MSLLLSPFIHSPRDSNRENHSEEERRMEGMSIDVCLLCILLPLLGTGAHLSSLVVFAAYFVTGASHARAARLRRTRRARRREQPAGQQVRFYFILCVRRRTPMMLCVSYAHTTGTEAPGVQKENCWAAGAFCVCVCVFL